MKNLFDQEKEEEACRYLWCEVIKNAYEEGLSDNENLKKQAINWFFEKESLECICESIGLDADQIRSQFFLQLNDQKKGKQKK